MRLSIRWRLTLWNTLALGVLLLGFCVLVYALMAHALYEQLDRALQAESRQLEQDERLPSDPEQRLRYWIDEFKEHENFLCVVYDTRGHVYLKTLEMAEQSVPPMSGSVPEAATFHNQEVPILGPQRVLSWQLKLPGTTYTVLHLAPLKDVNHELQELLLVLCMAGPVMLAASGGLAYWLARKALKPMDQLHRQASQITAERLDRRLPVRNPGDELGRLAQTINGMIGRLERSFAEIRRFTADASHELRTPLTAIRTEAEVALHKPMTLEEHQALLSSILEECERLTRLTDQLLQLAREDVNAPRPPHQPLDLAGLLAGVVETMRPLAEAKGITLKHERPEPLRIHGDEARLKQVFYNLLDNAIKYTPEGGTVEVQISRQEQNAIVRVSDTGIGIPPEHRQRVFDRFYRVDKARTRAEGGTGLGLSIAQSIVHSHGGTIELTSTPGLGTTGTVTLPEGPPIENTRTGEERDG
jgi:heavy metal sensor kinase